MRAVVTGGAGFIGGYLVAALRAAGWDVEVWDVAEDGKRGVENAAGLAAVCRGARAVFHLASLVEYRTCPDEHRSRIVNEEGTANVIAACRLAGVPTLVYLGSVEALYPLLPGEHYDAPEEELVLPRRHLAGVYGSTKARAERLVLEADGAELKTIVARTGHVVGVGDRNHIDPLFIFARDNGFVPLSYWGSKVPKQQLIDVRDAARGLLFMAEHVDEFHGQHISLAGDPALGWRVSLIEDWAQPFWVRHLGHVRTIRIPFWIAFFMAWAFEIVALLIRAASGYRIRSPFTRTAIHGTSRHATYDIGRLKRAGFVWNHSFEQSLRDQMREWTPPVE